MSHRACAVMVTALTFAHCVSAVHARPITLLGGGGAPVENDRAESGLPWLSLREEGMPFDRLPDWLQQLFDTDGELRRLRADLAALDAALDRDKAAQRASAHTPEEIDQAEAMVGGVPPVFAYAVIASPRNRARFLVIQALHGATCGSAGCTILLYMRTSGRWRLVGDEGGARVILERRPARGFPVFTIWTNQYSCSYRWNGARFQDEPGCPGW